MNSGNDTPAAGPAANPQHTKNEHDLSSSQDLKCDQKEILNVASDTHREEEVHDAGVQQRFPPGLGWLEHDILCGLKHGDVVAPQ